jgi:GNAT superfamily N-acetyltransferase
MFSIRTANANDVQAIYGLIYELAVFEKAPEQCINTPEQLLKDGFGAHPAYICFVAESDADIVGISLCYVRYSTWKGCCLYLEDLIVTESMRGNGIGKALFQHTLQFAESQSYARLQWQVLDWNQGAIDFYKAFNASFDSEWLNAWVELPEKR